MQLVLQVLHVSFVLKNKSYIYIMYDTYCTSSVFTIVIKYVETLSKTVSHCRSTHQLSLKEAKATCLHSRIRYLHGIYPEEDEEEEKEKDKEKEEEDKS